MRLLPVCLSTRFRVLPALLGVLASATLLQGQPAQAADRVKANNNDNLDRSTS